MNLRTVGNFLTVGWIYYNSPTILVFSEKVRNPDKWEKRLSLDLEHEFYFQLDDLEKQNLIFQFVSDCIKLIKEN